MEGQGNIFQMNSAKPPLNFSSSFQAHMVENPPTNGAPWINATIDKSNGAKTNLGLNYDRNVDPKKIRRIMANRDSAQRSRLRKVLYVKDLEMKAKEFEGQIAEDLRPQLALLKDEKHSLLLENETLTHRLNILQKEALLKNAEIEENTIEVKKLREEYNKLQEQRELMLNWNNTNVQPMSNDPLFSNYSSNPYGQDSQMWTPTVADKRETELGDLPSSMDLMNINYEDPKKFQ
ncbi:uncharacterized protein [Cicer arietinum]